MGILDAPGVSNFALGQSLRAQGLTLIGTGNNGLNSANGRYNGVGTPFARVLHYAAVDATNLRLVYGNWYNAATGGEPNASPVLVKASLERMSPVGVNTEDQPRIAVLFNGKRYGVCEGNGLLISDPVPFRVAKGEGFFSRTSVTATPFAANLPAAPTLTNATTGGALLAGQYWVAATWVYASHESLMGPATQSAATTGSTSTITVTAPTGGASAIGYRLWSTALGAAATTAFYVGSDLIPVGTDGVLKFPPNIAAQSQLSAAGGGGQGVPRGRYVLGGTTFSSINNGEGYQFVDLADSGAVTGSLFAQQLVYSPVGILGSVSGKPVQPSVAQQGDSIQAGTGDDGLGGAGMGGAVRRAVDGITTRTLVQGFVPTANYGLVSAGPIPGETLAHFLTSSGLARTKAALLATTVISNYGINDLSKTTSCGMTMASIVMEANLYVPAGVKLIKETLRPTTTSTDGWRTSANQTPYAFESYRQVINAWLRSAATVSAPVVGEVATDHTPDSSQKNFCPLNAFIVGTETVKVSGASTTAYTYRNLTYLADGRKIAGGVLFTTAPTTGQVVSFDYTPIPGFRAAVAPAGSALVDIFDNAAVVEVDASGVPSLTGGRWKAPPAGNVETGTVTAATSTQLTDSSKAWTVSGGAAAGFKGYCVRITADATTPASVGQVACIQYNSATALTWVSGALSPVPSVGATFEIFVGYTIDGTHPSSDGQVLISQAIDLSKVR